VRTNDIKSWTDRELISAILSVPDTDPTNEKKTHPVVKDILPVITEKKQLTTFEDLTCIEGIGKDVALKVLACYEISRRYHTNTQTIDKVTRPEDCLKFLEKYRRENQEYFIAINLNGAGEVLSVQEITKGLLNHSLVHPREVFAPAITDRAASIICAHNHPSGSLEPSSQDIAITRQLKEAGAIIGIPIIDHLIVTRDAYTSMREKGLL
jgi:DNA repair protein RadC